MTPGLDRRSFLALSAVPIAASAGALCPQTARAGGAATPPGRLPPARQFLFADPSAPPGGNGSRLAPLRDLPGSTPTDNRIVPGTRVILRGNWSSSQLAAAEREFRRGGTADEPVVYVGNDPSWGQARLVGFRRTIPTSRAPNMASTFGNPHWRNLRVGSLAPGDVGELAWPFYAPNLLGQWMPSLPAVQPFEETSFVPGAVLVARPQDMWWHPGQSASDPVRSPDLSRPRLPLAHIASQLGMSEAVLSAMLPPPVRPVAIVQTTNNFWEAFILRRCNAEGVFDDRGAFLTTADGQTVSAVTGTSFRLLNIPATLSRPGQVAYLPEEGQVIWWPEGGATVLHQADGQGWRLRAEHVWLHGFEVGGFGLAGLGEPTPFLTLSTAPGGGARNRVQRCRFTGIPLVGRGASESAFVRANGGQLFYLSGQRHAGAFVGASDASGIHLRNVHAVHVCRGFRMFGSEVNDMTVEIVRIEQQRDIHGNFTFYLNPNQRNRIRDVFVEGDRPFAGQQAAAGGVAFPSGQLVIENAAFVSQASYAFWIRTNQWRGLTMRNCMIGGAGFAVIAREGWERLGPPPKDCRVGVEEDYSGNNAAADFFGRDASCTLVRRTAPISVREAHLQACRQHGAAVLARAAPEGVGWRAGL